MKIKGFWKITYKATYSNDYVIVKAKTRQNAIKKFYKRKNDWWLVISIEPLIVKELEDEKEN